MRQPLENDAFQTEGYIPELPALHMLPEAERYDHLELIARTESFFVDQLMDNGALGVDIHRGRQNRLVFRKSFFRHQRARHIQFASWPFVLRTQGANVAQYLLQFILRERIAKGRHFPGKPANRSSLMGHRKPVGIGFAGCKAAVGEIGERNIETQ